MHDYNISWDYEIDKHVNKKYLTILNKIINDIKKNDLYKLKACKDFSVQPIILPKGILGIYCLGTYNKAVIGIDIRNLLIACEEYNTDIKISLKTTILHELKHSEQDYYADDNRLNFAKHHAKQIEKSLVKILNNLGCTVLSKLGTFSNGEAVFEKASV